MSFQIKHFIIYGKSKKGGRFAALDLSTCQFVDRLIFTTLLDREEAQQVINHLAEENPDFEFEARSQDGRKLTPQKALVQITA